MWAVQYGGEGSYLAFTELSQVPRTSRARGRGLNLKALWWKNSVPSAGYFFTRWLTLPFTAYFLPNYCLSSSFYGCEPRLCTGSKLWEWLLTQSATPNHCQWYYGHTATSLHTVSWKSDPAKTGRVDLRLFSLSQNATQNGKVIYKMGKKKSCLRASLSVI